MRKSQYILNVSAAAALLLSLTSCAPTATLTGQPRQATPAFGDSLKAAPECLALPGDCLEDALALLNEGKPAEAASYLESLKANYPGTGWAAKASFLIGYHSPENNTGLPDANAIKNFIGSMDLEAIGDYSLFYAGRAYGRSGYHAGAYIALERLVTLYPDSVLRPEADYRMAEALLKTGALPEAQKAFLEFAGKYPKSLYAPDALINSAEVSLELGDFEGARGAAKRAYIEFPANGVAKRSKALIDKLGAAGLKVELTLEERYVRAERLFSSALYMEALDEYSAVFKSADGALKEKAAIRRANSFIRLKRYGEAEKALREYASRPGRTMEAEALFELGLIALRQDNERLLAEAEQRLSASHRATPEHAKTLIYLGKLFEGRKEAEKAALYYKKAVELREPRTREEAMWSLGWLFYRNGRYDDAFEVLTSIPPSKESKRHLYWAGRSLERSAKPGDAAMLYKRLLEGPADFYSIMAQRRLGESREAGAAPDAIAPEDYFEVFGSSYFCSDLFFQRITDDELCADKAEGRTVREDAEHPLFFDRHYAAATELLSMGLTDLAKGEFDLLAKRYADDSGALIELATLFYRAEDYYRALRTYSAYSSKNGELPKLKEVSFPPKLVELIRRNVPDYHDPYLAAAIMREESHFNPMATSAVGAKGLMQLMPATGSQLAKELGVEGFAPEGLYDPDTNIRLGVMYLGQLAERFGNDLVKVIAGYNAGPYAVEKWTATLPSEHDEFIESIPYKETRDYVKKVLRSYNEFLRTSGSGLGEFKGLPAKAEGEKEAVEGEGRI